ncbi:hypothetical protein BT69DRAFT_131219 [Atractiella rhizophila]|nr:hypothetical protein BT69DRAFT_131219 [Atractiella rhizophila]
MRTLLKAQSWWDGPPLKFLYTEVLYEEDGDVYYFDEEDPSVCVDDAHVQTCAPGIRLDKKFYLPLLVNFEDKTQAPSDCLSNGFVKTPFSLGMHFRRVTDPTAADAYRTRDLYSHELETLDIISRRPHPNVCRYHGYVTDGTFITGLCFEKHHFTLWEAIFRNKRIDATFVLAEIRKGLEHLHSAGISHNDLSPTTLCLILTTKGC